MRIHLPQPCHENWHSMSLDEKGRHCQQCDKVVHDFTGFSDTELLAFFEREQGVCGRFKTSQLGRDLHNQSSHNLKWALATCSFLLLTHTDLEAQNAVVATDDSVAVANVFTQTQMIRVVRATIHQADTLADQITRIRMRLGELSIDTDIDSSNVVSISIPATEIGALADFELYNQSGDTIVLAGVGIGQGSMYFIYDNSRWTAFALNTIILPEHYPIYPPITMGVYFPYKFYRYPWVINTAVVDSIYTLGDTVTINHPDSLATDSLVSKGAVNNVKHSIEKSSNSGTSKAWWAVIIGGVGLALAWFWRRNKKRRA